MQKLINTKRLLDTFLEIVKIDTGSNPDSLSSPSTMCQLDLANLLKTKLQDLQLQNVYVDEFGIVYGELPANTEKHTPIMGLIAHMDTSSDVATGPVKPLVHNYQGGDIVLQNNVRISAEELHGCKGHQVITSDGTTLLGADDKAGVAEILETLAVLKDNPDILHPTLKIAFTPDEEVGRGTENFDIKKFGADFAYTIDGSAPTDIDTETFNAFNPRITITGVQVHTGYAYGKMINAIDLANQFMNRLPKDETPSTTKDKQGYFHLLNISGNPQQVEIDMLVRDFDYQKACERVSVLQHIVDDLQRQNPKAKFVFEPQERYHNMKEKLSEFLALIEITKKAVSMSGLTPKETFVRGGTDGAELTLHGLLTPNLGAGGENFHSLNEFVSLEVMCKCTENILHLISLWSECSADIMAEVMARR